ncbi:MAG: exopolysaccharide biosynthesis protein [Bdellovibrionales bacterium]|nr:exopolysaccharide biosynthesis protein [Bdellovibrionales bacterium]
MNAQQPIEEVNSFPSPEPAVRRKLSDILGTVFSENSNIHTYGELVDELSHHGMAVVLIIFSIPSALPIPAAGYSTVLSIPLMVIGLRVLLGKDTVWLPEKMRNREFRADKLAKLKRAMLKLVLLIEKFSKPRYAAFVKSSSTRIFLGLLICALSVSMALPIPGTNTLPAGGIFLIGFSLLEDDGILLVLGILYSLVALTLSTLIIWFGYEIVKATIHGLIG